jgi:hypothetical protein
MKSCPLYNGQNLNFTGKANPYGLIQMGGKRKSRRSKKSMLKQSNKKRIKGRKTRKYRR